MKTTTELYSSITSFIPDSKTPANPLSLPKGTQKPWSMAIHKRPCVFLVSSPVKTILLITLLGIYHPCSYAQEVRECGTPAGKTRVFPDTTNIHLMAPMATYPLLVKVFVHVVANDDGTNVAAGDSSVMRQMENMRQFYAAHGICFILAGYEQINSTDLNNQNADTEEAELFPFLIPNMINVFVHANLVDNDGGLNGNAYGIPNYYLSISRSAITSTQNRSTLSHEMGHDFGLYHTFQGRDDGSGTIIRENVARSGNCKNCDTEGDLLCDTKADRNNDADVISETTCAYIGSMNDACGTALQMEPTNIMTYGRRSCRDHFTAGQGNRAEGFILTTNFLTNALAADALLLTLPVSLNSGRVFYIARNSVTVNTTSFNITGSARANMSSREVTLSPGITLSPSGNGYTWVGAKSFCQ
jgi:hypothetical protein